MFLSVQRMKNAFRTRETYDFASKNEDTARGGVASRLEETPPFWGLLTVTF